MSEDALAERLKWIRDEYFEGSQSALAKAMGCSPGYVTPLISGEKKNLGNLLMENLVNTLSKKEGARWVTVRWLAHGGERGVALNESTSTQSKDATLRMFEEERKEFATAIQWLIERADSEHALEQLHKEVCSARISRAAKQAVLAAVLREQERRERAAPKQN